MRYLLLTYYKKPDGKIDEVMAVAKNLKLRDHQTCSVILDFKTLSVLKCSMGGAQVPKDFDRITAYYHQHYAIACANIVFKLVPVFEYKSVFFHPD